MMKKTIKQVVKACGDFQEFNEEKILRSIWVAAQNVGGSNEKLAVKLKEEIIQILSERYPNGEKIRTSEIGELVEKVLIEHGHAKTAKEFIRYRENKKHLRQDKTTLGINDDIGLSYNTLYILKMRYLKRNEKGDIVETPVKMIKRVAKCLSDVEKTQKKRKFWYKKFLDLMLSFKFLPGTRTLANAGKTRPQLANCFVWPVEDDINKIFEILHKSTLIKKHGGGCGYNFSKIRPEGDVVGGIPNLAAGPVRMVEMFNLMTSLFKQEGKYESGNMAILNANHPDIFNFISAKSNDGYLSKTNISVGITDEFMEAVIQGKDWDLINPRTGEVVNTVKAKSILELMSQMAWQTGDPGMVNLSAINKGTAMANPLLEKCGPLSATNPCGEVPLYPYESCNLGYINLTKFVKLRKNGQVYFDYKELKEIMGVSVRLMDNVIDASWFPVKEVLKSVKDHRRIGIGCVGWAEALAIMEIAYDSEEAFNFAERIAEAMYKSAFLASLEISEEKGPFPLINESIWENRKEKPRNVALLTFPPSSGNAVICETSYGIEPFFALVYEQNILEGMKLKSVVPLLEKKLKNCGVYNDDIIQKIVLNHGSIQGISEIPKNLRDVFKIAHDIDFRDHIRMQAAFQRWTDNAITKTINMPSSATVKDIEEAYILAWKLGCKGLTVYRDKSKDGQVFDFGHNDKSLLVERKCPTCNIKLVRDNKCFKCKKCGFSTCEL